MGIIIKMPQLQEKQKNIKELKALIDKYIKGDKKFVIEKMKKEQ